MTEVENRLAETLRETLPWLGPTNKPRPIERRVALQLAREALSEFDRAVIAETRAG